MENDKFYFRTPHIGITYVASDGKKFKNKIKYLVYQKKLNRLKIEWYNKRYSFWGDLMYFLFKKEPIKPYNF